MEVVCLFLGPKLSSRLFLHAFWIFTSVHIPSFYQKCFYYFCYNYTLAQCYLYINVDIMHNIQSVQILTSVLRKQMVALKHVQTLLEASFVDVMVLVIHWMMIGLLVMVCRSCI